MTRHTIHTIIALALAVSPPIPCLAPMPPCSPFILMNKLIESSNLMSDIHPYYPIPPCPHGGPLEALAKGDTESVFIKGVPGHLWYELSWLLAIGLPRKLKALQGEYPVKINTDILTEGYQHHTRHPRTRQFGHSSFRNPSMFNNKNAFDKVVAGNYRKLNQHLNFLIRK